MESGSLAVGDKIAMARTGNIGNSNSSSYGEMGLNRVVSCGSQSIDFDGTAVAAGGSGGTSSNSSGASQHALHAQLALEFAQYKQQQLENEQVARRQEEQRVAADAQKDSKLAQLQQELDAQLAR